MATLTANKFRVMELTGPHPQYNELPVAAAARIFGGAAVGEVAATGIARPLVALDNFMGFCDEEADNRTGAASAINVKVKEKGFAKLVVVGVVGPGDYDAPVYALDDDSFTLTSTGATQIGKVKRHISGTTCLVAFESTASRSV